MEVMHTADWEPSFRCCLIESSVIIVYQIERGNLQLFVLLSVSVAI